MPHLHPTAAALVLVAACGFGPPPEARPSPWLTMGPCQLPGLSGEARCGTYLVPENRHPAPGPDGRTPDLQRNLSLRVAVLPATGPDPAPDPVVSFAGGPGQSAVEEAGALAMTHGGLRARRDFVLIDLRGTGGSAALDCDALRGNRGVQGFLDDFLPLEAVRACRAAHAKRDLAQYRTAVAVDDVAEVLDALGYRQVNAWGGSYGTRTALELARRHPQRVRTLGLMGLVPPDARSPLTFARDAQDALDGTLRACAADAACAKAFPHVAEELAAVLARLERQPVTVRMRDPESGAAGELRLTRHGVAQTIRYMLYIPSTAVLIPLYVHAAAAGDFQPLGDTAALFGRLGTGMSDGYFLSVTCSEDVPFIDEAAAASAVRGTFLDDFRIRAQQAACREWRVPPAPAEDRTPVSSAAPALLFSGERDPVTPARWGEEVARTLPNAVHLVVPGGGHGFEGMRGTDCIDKLFDQLVEKGTTRGLDTSCVAAIAGPPFPTELAPGEVALTVAQRDRLLGTYAGAEGLVVTIDLTGDRLRLNLVGEKSFLLVPQSPSRFGFDGLPLSYAVEVVETAGKVTGLRLVGMTDEPMVLVRR